MYLGLSPEHNRGEKRHPDCDKLGKMSSWFHWCGTFCFTSVRGFGAGLRCTEHKGAEPYIRPVLTIYKRLYNHLTCSGIHVGDSCVSNKISSRPQHVGNSKQVRARSVLQEIEHWYWSYIRHWLLRGYPDYTRLRLSSEHNVLPCTESNGEEFFLNRNEIELFLSGNRIAIRKSKMCRIEN